MQLVRSAWLRGQLELLPVGSDRQAGSQAPQAPRLDISYSASGGTGDSGQQRRLVVSPGRGAGVTVAEEVAAGAGAGLV